LPARYIPHSKSGRHIVRTRILCDLYHDNQYRDHRFSNPSHGRLRNVDCTIQLCVFMQAYYDQLNHSGDFNHFRDINHSGEATSTTGYLPGCSPISSNNLVQNGGFECLYWVDWSPKDVANTYHIDTTGQSSYTSYEFKLRGNPASTTEVASLSQDVPGFTVGASYVLNYGSWWSTCDQSIGFIDIKLNYQSVTTINPCQGTVAGLGWVNGTFGPFTAVSNVENLRFEFVLSLNQNDDDIRLDNIAITPA